MNPVHVWFHFPDGGIWSNILASIIWTTPSFLLGLYVSHRKIKKHITHEHEESRKHLEKHVGKYEH